MVLGAELGLEAEPVLALQGRGLGSRPPAAQGDYRVNRWDQTL